MDDVGGHVGLDPLLGLRLGLVGGLAPRGLHPLHQVGLGALALRRDRGVGVGHLHQRRGGRAQDVGQVRTQAGGVLRQAQGHGRLHGLLRTDLLVELDVGGVDRLGEGHPQVEQTEGDVAEVAHLDLATGRAEGHRARPGQLGVRGDALPHGRGQGDRLEQRARLDLRVRGGVELGLLVVLPAVHRGDRAVPGAHGGERGGDVVGVLAGGGERLDGLDRRLLVLLDDGRGDPQAPGVDGGVLQPQQVAQVLPDLLRDIPLDPLRRAGRRGRPDLGEVGGVPLALAEPALLDHPVQDVGDPVPGPFLVAVGEVGVEQGRRVGDGREEGALADRQLRGVLVEVGAAGRLDPVGPTTEVDGVEVVLQDLVLGLLVVDLHRDDQLAELALQRLLLGQVVVLDVLLGDRRAALHPLPAQRAPGAPRQPGDRDPLVLVEGPVLGGQHGLLHVLGHLVQRHGLPVEPAGEPGHLRLAVGVVEDGALGLGEVVGLGHVRAGVGPGQRGRQQHHDEQGQAHQPEQDAAQTARPTTAPALGRTSGGAGAGRTHADHCAWAP